MSGWYIGGSKIWFLIFCDFDPIFVNFERIIKWAIRNRFNSRFHGSIARYLSFHLVKLQLRTAHHLALYQRILMTGWKCQILRNPVKSFNFIDFCTDFAFLYGFFKFSKFDPLSKSDLKTTNYAPFAAGIFRDGSLDMKLVIREIREIIYRIQKLTGKSILKIKTKNLTCENLEKYHNWHAKSVKKM